MFKAYAGIRRVGWYCAILVLAVLELKGGCANMGGCAVTRGCTRLGYCGGLGAIIISKPMLVKTFSVWSWLSWELS